MGFSMWNYTKGGTGFPYFFDVISKKQREGEELMVNGRDTETTLTVVVPISYGPFESMLR